MCGPAAGKKINYYSNPSNMGKESGKGKDKARQAKASADALRETREKRLEARTLSQSHSDGLAGAAAAATAAASMGVKSSKGSTVSSPPRTDRGRSADAESPLNNKGRRSNSGRRVSPEKSSVENSEAEGSDQSVAASGSEDELLATNAKAVATQKLEVKAKIAAKVDSNAT
jgi:hypothetical protein